MRSRPHICPANWPRNSLARVARPAHRRRTGGATGLWLGRRECSFLKRSDTVAHGVRIAASGSKTALAERDKTRAGEASGSIPRALRPAASEAPPTSSHDAA